MGNVSSDAALTLALTLNEIAILENYDRRGNHWFICRVGGAGADSGEEAVGRESDSR